LGDATRLALVARLIDGEVSSIAQLTAGTRLTRQAVTKHLRVMQRAGMVRCTRSGRESLFALELEPIESALTYLDSLAQQWDRALSRLKTFVEEE
jgi:DNA-binding transcriptional ArsR family regulator